MSYFSLRIIGLWFLAFNCGAIGSFALLSCGRLINGGPLSDVALYGTPYSPYTLLQLIGYLAGILLGTIWLSKDILKKPKNVFGAFLGTMQAGAIILFLYFFIFRGTNGSVPPWILLLLWPLSAVWPTVGMLVFDRYFKSTKKRTQRTVLGRKGIKKPAPVNQNSRLRKSFVGQVGGQATGLTQV